MKQAVDLNFRHIYLRHFISSAVLPILVIFIALSAYYNTQAAKFSQEVLAGALGAGENALETSFAELEQISFTPYLYNEVSQAMTYMKNGYLKEGADSPAHLNVARLETNYTMLFTKMLHSSQQKVLSICFYPFGAGRGESYTIDRNQAGLKRAVCSTEEVAALYENTQPYGSRPVFLVLEEGSGQSETYTLLRAIKDYDSGKELGILRVDTDMDSLTSGLKSMSVTANSFLVLQDSRGRLAYASGEVSPELLDKAAGGAEESNYGGRRYAFQQRSPGATGWTLRSLSSLNDVRLSTASSVLIIFVITLLAFLAAFWLYRAQSAGMISSIEAILAAIRQLQNGNLSYVCQVKDKKELLLIAEALNETGRKLDDLIKTEAEARTSQSKAEYLALQSQINPHFLYNTLNGFIALNRLGEKQLLEDSILHLTKLFRYICSNSDVTTVAQEFDFATQYLELQKLRFEERVNFTVVVGDGTATATIPKLVIQPIVENCIVHGMEEDDEPIEILLRSCLNEEVDGVVTLVLEIVDTGVGFDTDQAQRLPRVGLSNVMQRLSLFRVDSRYEVRSAPGRGTTVRIIIPL